jgi:hypothetical protein
MFTKTAIALAIIVGAASCAMAATKESKSIDQWDAYDCRGVSVGSNPRVLINRPHNGMCHRAE